MCLVRLQGQGFPRSTSPSARTCKSEQFDVPHLHAPAAQSARLIFMLAERNISSSPIVSGVGLSIHGLPPHRAAAVLSEHTLQAFTVPSLPRRPCLSCGCRRAPARARRRRRPTAPPPSSASCRRSTTCWLLRAQVIQLATIIFFSASHALCSCHPDCCVEAAAPAGTYQHMHWLQRCFYYHIVIAGFLHPADTRRPAGAVSKSGRKPENPPQAGHRGSSSPRLKLGATKGLLSPLRSRAVSLLQTRFNVRRSALRASPIGLHADALLLSIAPHLEHCSRLWHRQAHAQRCVYGSHTACASPNDGVVLQMSHGSYGAKQPFPQQAPGTVASRKAQPMTGLRTAEVENLSQAVKAPVAMPAPTVPEQTEHDIAAEEVCTHQTLQLNVCSSQGHIPKRQLL